MKNKYAFTLIELLVVVLIIGILSAVAVPQYKRAVVKSEFAGVLMQLKTLYDVEQLYYLENGRYASSDELVISGLPPIAYSKNHGKYRSGFAWKDVTIEFFPDTGEVRCFHYGVVKPKAECLAIVQSDGYCESNLCRITTFK